MKPRVLLTGITRSAVLMILLLAFAAPAALAIDASLVPQNKRSVLGLYLTAGEAYELVKQKKNGVFLVDVRDPGEVFTVGMPTVAHANIPFRYINFHEWNNKKSTFAMDDNPDFVTAMDKYLSERHLTRGDPVIIICSSGRRAPKAVNALALAGYTMVYAVIDGYEAWQKHKLPWSRKLDREKMYVFDAKVQ